MCLLAWPVCSLPLKNSLDEDPEIQQYQCTEQYTGTDKGTSGGEYPKPKPLSLATTHSKAGFKHWLRKTLRSLSKVGVRSVYKMSSKFNFNGMVKVVEDVPLIVQNQKHGGKDINGIKLYPAAHSCWAYARTIALYHSGKMKDYAGVGKKTPWQVAEWLFWAKVDDVRKNNPQYEGDHAFHPKDECPTSLSLASPKEVMMDHETLYKVIRELLDGNVLITGMGKCKDTTDHYSNIVGFTSSLRSDFNYPTNGCWGDAYNKDLKVTKADEGWEAAQKRINLAKQYFKKYEKQPEQKETSMNNLYSSESRIFQSDCHLKAYLTRLGLDELVPKFHLVIAQPWCTDEIDTKSHTKTDFFNTFTKRDCVTGPNNIIKKGTHGNCDKAGEPITQWKCLREIPFLIKHGKEVESKFDHCKSHYLIEYPNNKNDFLYNNKTSVLTGDWGYVQYLWSVQKLKGRKH